jgi:2'-5' RNA ligase
MSKTVRCFIAIHLSQELKSLMWQVGEQIEGRIPPKTVRWVKPHAMHLTLVFLGNTPVDKLDDIQNAMTAAAASVSPISFRAVGLGCFPNPRRPRVVWVGIDEPAGQLRQLKRALDDALEPLGFPPEKRRFSPHLTLGRVNKRAGRRQVQQLGQVIESATLKELAQITLKELHLIQSDLRPEGPLYTTLARAPLG